MIKLKQLIEGFQKNENITPVKQEGDYGTLSPLSKEEKIYLMGTIGDYNQYRDELKPTKMYECAKKINNAISLAERYVMSECNEWMQAEMAKKDIKEIKKLSDKMVSILEKSKHLCPVEKQAGESPTPIWGDGRFTSAGNADC